MFCRDNVLVTLQRAHALTRLSSFLRRCRRLLRRVRHHCFSKEDRERSYLSSLASFASSTLSIGLDYSVARASDRAATDCLPRGPLESVRRLHAGLQSFLSMRRIEARCKNASAFRLRFSQSLASLRQRLSHAMVRSTIQRLGKTANPLT